jgi:hypothetical protein
MMSRIAPLVPVLLGAIACGCGADSEISKPLCDPSQPSAGRVAVEMRDNPGRVARGQAVMYDNGAHYIFVDGQCNYWVNHPNQVWDETRSGVLDVETAARLGESLHFGAWSDLRGTWSGDGGVFDAPVLIFDDAMSAVICADLCDGPGVAGAVKAMRDAFPVVAQELWDRGSPAASGVRAIAVAGQPGPGIPFVDWPLARPIADFVRSGQSIGVGEGTLEADVASARSLQELRASFLRGDHGAFVWNMLPVMSDGAYYQLYLRDALPFENELGLVPLSVD